MPTFPDDALVADETPRRRRSCSCAPTARMTLLHALRDLMRATRGALAPRWKVEGFLPAAAARAAAPGATCSASRTAPPTRTTADAALMDRLVWAATASRLGRRRHLPGGAHHPQPRRVLGPRRALSEQELMIGRDKDTGAPLGRAERGRRPRLRRRPQGRADPARRAHPPRAPAHAADRGLAHPAPRLQLLARARPGRPARHGAALRAASRRDVEQQFEAVQKRLAGEPLVDYVVPDRRRLLLRRRPARATPRTGSARGCSPETRRPAGRALRRARRRGRYRTANGPSVLPLIAFLARRLWSSKSPDLDFASVHAAWAAPSPSSLIALVLRLFVVSHAWW